MVLERIRPFRLVERGRGGLACDAEGISLGAVALVALSPDKHCDPRYVVRSAGEVGDILKCAYGHQREEVIQRCHRGLRRAASALQMEDVALAGIEAVMLGLPDLTSDAVAKLANLADLEKGGDSWRNEPRVPPGQTEGGQWTTGGGGPSGPRTAPKPLQRPPHERTADQATTKPRAYQSRQASATGRPASGSVPRPRQEQSRSNDPVSSFVDFSNTVASRIVDAARWLQQPAGEVPIAPEIAAGEPGFPMGAALEETTDPNALRDRRPVSHLEVGLDALGVAGAVVPGVRAVAEGAEAAGEVKRFASIYALRRYLGPAGKGYQWHHIVEQTPKNLETFGAEAIHSTDNVVRVPTSVHVGKNSISAFYSSSKQRFTDGRTVREWLSTQSFAAQRRFGIKTLRRFGQWK